MLFKINDVDVNRVKDLLKANSIGVEAMYESEYSAYVCDEFNGVENYYKGIIGEDTIKAVREKAEEDLDSMDFDSIATDYDKKLTKACELLDAKAIGVCTISNTLGVELKEFSVTSDSAIVKYGNELYNCDIDYNADGDAIIKIGELELLMSDFIRV